RMHHGWTTCLPRDRGRSSVPVRTYWRLSRPLRAANTAVLGAVREGWDTGWNASLPAHATDDRRRLWFSAPIGARARPDEVVAVPERPPANPRGSDARAEGQADRCRLRPRLVGCRRLPESWAQSAFRLSADLGWRRQARGVQVLEGNLRRVIGSQAPETQLRALSKEAMCSYARYWLEAFRLPVMPMGRLVAEMHDTGHLRAAFEYL